MDGILELSACLFVIATIHELELRWSDALTFCVVLRQNNVTRAKATKRILSAFSTSFYHEL